MAASTAVSTLVLAIEARNQTAAAFAQIRSALAGQVTAAREAAQQQLLANKQALAQQVLAQRQAMEQQAAAIRAGGGATAAAQVTAARHAYAQQALAARQSAEQQAAAIKSGLAQQVDAYRSAARQEEAALRSVSAGGAVRGSGVHAAGAGAGGGHAEGGSWISGLADFGKQMLVWNYAAGAINRVTEAVGGFASGLVTSNATLEQMTQTFSAIYGSADKGAQAVRWLDDFAQKVPATREEVMAAGLSLASMGDNIGAVLPRLSNVAAVMGVDLPTAAQALNDAMTGDTQMLRQRLHIQIADLEQFGAKVEANGHIVEGTLLPAFQKLADARFGEKGPLGKSGIQAQMETFTGKMSNVADAITRLQEVGGHAVFDVFKGSLDGVIKMLQSKDVMVFAYHIGEALGHIVQAVIQLARWVAQLLAPAWRASLELMHGDTVHAKEDLIQTWKGLEVALLKITNGLIDGIIKAFHALAGPIATVLNAVFVPVFIKIVELGIELFSYLALKVGTIFAGMGDSLVNAVLSVPDKISGVSHKMGEQVRHLLGLPTGAGARAGAHARPGTAAPPADDVVWAQAHALGKGTADVVGALLGPHPIPTIKFDDKKLVAGVDQFFADAIKHVGYKPGQGAIRPQDKEKLPKWLQDMLDAGAGGAGEPPAGTDYGTGLGAREAAAAARDLVSERRDAFQLLLSRGPVTWAAGIKDIGAIASAERAAGTSKTQVTLDILGSTKQLIDALLKQARDHFDLDRAHHAGQKTLLADENAYLAILARTPGITKDQLALARIDLDKERGAATPAAKAVAAYKQAGFDLTSGASYGTTTVTLGPVRDQLIAHLQAQLIELRGQKVRDEKQIAILQDELHEAIKGNQYLQAIVNNTAGTHQATQKTAQHVSKPQPRSGAHGFTQRTGVPVPI